jgi:hypothetical protein
MVFIHSRFRQNKKVPLLCLRLSLQGQGNGVNLEHYGCPGQNDISFYVLHVIYVTHVISCKFMQIHVIQLIYVVHVISYKFYANIFHFKSNHVNSCHSSQVMLFVSIHAIYVNSSHSCQFMPFMSIHAIHVNSCHSCQFMPFMSIHTIHVNSCHSSHLSLDFSVNSVKWGARWAGRVSRICLPRPSATALLSGRKGKNKH